MTMQAPWLDCRFHPEVPAARFLPHPRSWGPCHLPLSQSADHPGSTERSPQSQLIQELTIVNDETKESTTTTRYFLPFYGKVEVEDVDIMDES